MKSVQNNICSSFLRSIVASALTKNPKECTLFVCFLNSLGDIISISSFESPGISFDTNSLCNQTGIKRKICSCFTICKRNLLKIKQVQLPEALMGMVRHWTIAPISVIFFWSHKAFAPTSDWGEGKYVGFLMLVKILQCWNNWMMATGVLVKRLQGNVPPLFLPLFKTFQTITDARVVKQKVKWIPCYWFSFWTSFSSSSFWVFSRSGGYFARWKIFCGEAWKRQCCRICPVQSLSCLGTVQEKQKHLCC